MSIESTTAVLNLAQELTAEEFRLLLLITEASTDYKGWLTVNWDNVLDKCGLTEQQCGRILRGLQSGGLIAVGTGNWAIQMSVGDLRCPVPLQPAVLVWIAGMTAPGTEQSPKEHYRKRPVPRSIRDYVFERDNYTCRHCGDTEALTVDHIHPESKGGTAEPDNLQTLCRTCNSRKGTRVAVS